MSLPLPWELVEDHNMDADTRKPPSNNNEKDDEEAALAGGASAGFVFAGIARGIYEPVNFVAARACFTRYSQTHTYFFQHMTKPLFMPLSRKESLCCPRRRRFCRLVVSRNKRRYPAAGIPQTSIVKKQSLPKEALPEEYQEVRLA